MKQKREMRDQHNVDMRQMALLLHLQLSWQHWWTQKEEWWKRAKEWTRTLWQVRTAEDERRQRSKILEDRGYWNVGVIAIHSDGIRAAIAMEERRERTTQKLMMMENKYRIKQSAREQEVRWTMERERLLGLARRGRKKWTREEKEERMGIQHAWEMEETMRRQTAERRSIEREESSKLQTLNAGARRAYNESRNRENKTLTHADIAETREFLVPGMDPTEAARRRQSTQFGSKRRREQPSDGRERSSMPKRRK